MNPSFSLCSSSHCKCAWKKHSTEEVLQTGMLLSTCFLTRSSSAQHAGWLLDGGFLSLSVTHYMMELHQCYERKAMIWNQKTVWTFEALYGIDGGTEACKANMSEKERGDACRDLIEKMDIFNLVRCIPQSHGFGKRLCREKCSK